jgi:hypothetical protein
MSAPFHRAATHIQAAIAACREDGLQPDDASGALLRAAIDLMLERHGVGFAVATLLVTAETLFESCKAGSHVH